MIEEIPGLPAGTLGFKISGDVTGDDYDNVLTPAVDKAIEEFDRIKFLAQIGPDFNGYSLDAAWDDAKLGLRHWMGFERVAVATDVGWVRTWGKLGHGLKTCGLRRTLCCAGYVAHSGYRG